VEKLWSAELNNLELIQAIAYTSMADLCLAHTKNENAEGLACTPLGYVHMLESWLHTGITEDLDDAFPEATLEAAEIIFQDILDGSALGNVLKDFSAGINPIRHIAKNALKDLDDSPEFLRIRDILQKDGLPLVLGCIDEMMNRGCTEGDILFNQIRVEKMLAGYLDDYGDAVPEDVTVENGLCHQSEFLDDFSERVIFNWNFGMVDGSVNSTKAKAGRISGGAGGAVLGAKAGAVVGSVIPVAGTIVGAAVGGVLGNILGKTVGEEVTREMDVEQVTDSALSAASALSIDPIRNIKKTFGALSRFLDDAKEK